MPRRPRTTPEQRSRFLAQWAESGLSAVAFSRRSGVAAWTLYSWRREIRAKAEKQSAGGEAPAFAEIVLRSSSGDDAAPQPALAASPIEILIGDACVRVCPAFDDEHLRRVLDVLRRAG